MNANFKIDGKILETDRLILRAFEEYDLDDFYEYASIAGVGEKAGWKHHESKEESKNILDNFIEDNKTFAIYHKKDNKTIGSIGVEKYGPEEELIEFKSYIGRELGFVLSKNYWRCGLMSEAIFKIIEYLFNTLNYDFLLAGYFAYNGASKNLQKKCGFKAYKKTVLTTNMNTKEPGTLNILLNPNRNINIKPNYL